MRTSPADSRGSGIELSEGLGHQVPEYLLGSDRSWVRNGLAVASLLAGLVVVGTLALGPTDQLAQMLQPRTPNSLGPSQADGANPSPKADVAAIPAPIHPISESQKTDSEPNTEPKSSADAPPAVLPDIAPTTPSPSLKDEASVRDGETKPKGELANSARIDSVSDQLPSGAIQWLPVSTDLAEAIVLVLPSPGSASDWAIAQAGMQPSGGVWVVPTTQRTEFRLRGGSRVILCGETELRDIGSSEVPDSTVRSSVAAIVPYGRLILFPSPDQTTIQIGTTAGVLQVAFADKNSSCALEIRHIWSGWNSQPNLPRENPNAYATSLAGTVQTECVIELIGLQGSFSATLKPPSGPLIGESQIVEVGDRLVFRPSGSAAVEPLDLTPDWLRSSVERPIDQHSARDISKGLASAQDSPLEAIRQMTSHRKGETASMATRILAQLGDFSPLVGPNSLLGRKGVFIHSSAWLNKLPNFAHSKERILSLVESFVQGEPDRAETLLRLLIPYSNTQLAEGGDRILVEALSSGLLDERVLAIVQLTSLTGKTFSYHPEKNSADSMQQWRKLLSRAEIRRTESAPGL